MKLGCRFSHFLDLLAQDVHAPEVQALWSDISHRNTPVESEVTSALKPLCTTQTWNSDSFIKEADIFWHKHRLLCQMIRCGESQLCFPSLLWAAGAELTDGSAGAGQSDGVFLERSCWNTSCSLNFKQVDAEQIYVFTPCTTAGFKQRRSTEGDLKVVVKQQITKILQISFSCCCRMFYFL